MEENTTSELSLEDLTLLEERVQTIEKFLGIGQDDGSSIVEDVKFIKDNVNNLIEFNNNLDKKYDFYSIIDDYRQIKDLLEAPHQYKNVMTDTKKKVEFIERSKENISEFHKTLGEIQELRGTLAFKPVFNVNQKMKELNKLNKTQLLQSNEANETNKEVSKLIETYNDLIEGISQKFATLDIQLSKLEQSKS